MGPGLKAEPWPRHGILFPNAQPIFIDPPDPHMTDAAELRFVQLGALALRLNALDIDAIEKALEQRRGQAPDLLSSARLLLDLNPLAEVAPVQTGVLSELIERLARRGFPVFGLVAGPLAGQQAQALGLPVLSSVAEMRQAARPVARSGASEAPPPPATAAVGLHIERQVRSGQQVYARDGDLVIHGNVSAGAEVIADGSIHIYGALRGRALAGAEGREQARVYCQEFHAELVSVAGHYKVLEELPKPLRGLAIQVWLEDGQLRMDRLR
jgi:septum site-determining protein MinC